MASLRELAAEFQFSGDLGFLNKLDSALNFVREKIRVLAGKKQEIKVDANTKPLDDAKKKVEDTTKSVFELSKSLGKLKKDFGEGAANPFQTIFKYLTEKDVSKTQLLGAATSILGIGAAIKAVTGTVSIFSSELKNLHALNDKAVASGLGIEKYQELDFVFSRAGIEATTLTGTVEKLTQDLVHSGDATNNTIKSYKELGIELLGVDGKARSTADVLDDIRKKYQEDPAKNAAKIQQVLGGQYAKLTGYLTLTDEAYNSLTDEQKKNGIVTQQMADSAILVNDAIDSLQKKIKFLAGSVIGLIGPAISFVIGQIQEVFGIFGRLFGFLKSDKSIEDWAWEIEEYTILAWNAFAKFVNNLLLIWGKVKKFYSDFVDGTLEWQTEIEVAIAAVGAAMTVLAISKIPALITAIAGLWPVVVTAVAKFAMYTASLWAANTAQLALLASNPMTWIVLAAAAIAGLAVIIYKNWDEITGYLKGVGESVSNWFGDTISKIEKRFGELLSKIKDGLKKVPLLGKLFSGRDGKDGKDSAPGKDGKDGSSEIYPPIVPITNSSVKSSVVENNSTEINNTIRDINIHTQASDSVGVAKEVQKTINKVGFNAANAKYKEKR